MGCVRLRRLRPVNIVLFPKSVMCCHPWQIKAMRIWSHDSKFELAGQGPIFYLHSTRHYHPVIQCIECRPIILPSVSVTIAQNPYSPIAIFS